MHANQVTEFDPQVITGNLVHLYATLFDVVGTQTDENGVTPLLSSADAIREMQKSRDSGDYLTMIVSPRKRDKTSIVAGFRVATTSI